MKFIVGALFLLSFSLFSSLPPYLMDQEITASAQQRLKQLTLDQKLGHIFMIKVSPKYSLEDYCQFIDSYHIGGIFLHSGMSIKPQIEWVNRLQKDRDLPLLVGQDLEWGLAMRLTDGMNFPYALTLGAITNNQLIYELGLEIGRQCKLVGVNFNAAPVVDINTNPHNPVIGFRSFGDDKENVAQKACMFIRGLQEQGILACAKHFPGHGDTNLDSHKALPSVAHSKERLDKIELYPFKAAIEEGVSTIMSAHIVTQAYDDQQAATLSREVITELLKNKLGFKGLCITDALSMKAISKHYSSAEANIAAFCAGNDILLYAKEIPYTIIELKNLINQNPDLEKQLDNSVLKILQAREWVKKFHTYPLQDDKVESFINSKQAYQLKQKLYEQAITLINNENKRIPFNWDELKKTRPSIKLVQGGTQLDSFEKECDTIYTTHFTSSKKEKHKELYIYAIHTSPRGKTDEKLIQHLNNKFQKNRNGVVAVLFGNPYTLSKLNPEIPTLIAYEPDPDAQKAAARILLGQKEALGKLPIQCT